MHLFSNEFLTFQIELENQLNSDFHTIGVNLYTSHNRYVRVITNLTDHKRRQAL